MKTMIRASLATALGLLLSTQALAQAAGKAKDDKADVTLKVGDKAPALNVEKWVKGEPVSTFEPGKVYVVEFWATWCGPCIKSIPHLTELQKEHPEVTIIGMASSERQKGEDDKRLEGVKSFVSEQGDAMGYRIAYEGDKEMATAWMKAAGQRGIPCSFIVGGDGKIAYIGHPSKMDEPLETAIAAAKKTRTR
jgi:thiol-disulfide isomerase/thioredoxin